MGQRIDRVIRLHRRQDAERIAFTVMQQRRARHRQVSDAPGAHQIAEIDHTLQLPMSLRITLPHHVVIGDVHVDGLHRQLVDQGLQAALSEFGCVGDQLALGVIPDHRQQMRDQRLGMTRVPLQGAHQPRMIECRQRQIHLAAQATKTGHHRGVEIIEVRQRLALDVVQ
ncbi:hypothetical protein D3C87_1184700 [compost metagenome]